MRMAWTWSCCRVVGNKAMLEPGQSRSTAGHYSSLCILAMSTGAVHFMIVHSYRCRDVLFDRLS